MSACLLSACGGESPPAVTAGELVFTAGDVLGLSDDRRLLLGELGVFGIAVADSALVDVGRPWIEAEAVALLWARTQAQAALDSAGIGDDVLEARYRTAPEFELTVRHLLVFSERYETDVTRTAARDKATAALARIQAGEPFPTVAAEVSEEPGATSREGLLTPGRRGAWVSEFWDAASGLQPGEISPVVETQYGFHVLRLEARDTVPFAEVRPRIASEVAALMGLRPGGLETVPMPSPLPDTPPASMFDDATIPDDTPVVDGDGWAVRVGDVRDAAALLPYARWARRAVDPEVRQEALFGAMRRAIGQARADAAGVTLDDDARTGIEREWTDPGSTWALQLGFAPGLSPVQVRSTALGALSTTRQNASLARDGVRSMWGPLLHRWLPITLATPLEETQGPPGA